MLDVAVVEQLVETSMLQHQVPAFALAVVAGGELVYARGFGVTSVEGPGQAITPDTLFCSGSISKSFTGVAALRLVEQGKLELDRPVTDYLPWLNFSGPGAPDVSDGISTRRLLSHTSGLFGMGAISAPATWTVCKPSSDRRCRWLILWPHRAEFSIIPTWVLPSSVVS